MSNANHVEMEPCHNTFQVLLRQEVSNAYSCGDYLQLLRNHGEVSAVRNLPSSSSCMLNYQGHMGSSPTSVFTVNELEEADHHMHVVSDDDVLTENPTPCLMNESWRESICLWAYDITDRLAIDRSIVEVCMSNLDRFLYRHYGLGLNNGNQSPLPNTLTKEALQLCSVTCLYTATKITDQLNCRRKLSLSMFVKAASGQFNEEDMRQMELKILSTLGWFVNPPTRLDYARMLVHEAIAHLRLSEGQRNISGTDYWLKTKEDIDQCVDTMRFIIELSVCDYYFVTKRPSMIASAAVTLASQIVKHKRSSSGFADFLAAFVARSIKANEGYCRDEIKSIFNRLYDLYTRSTEHIVTINENNQESQTIVSDDESA